MKRYILYIIVFFNLITELKGQIHNAEPINSDFDSWIMVTFNINGSNNNYCNSNVNDDFIYCITATHIDRKSVV